MSLSLLLPAALAALGALLLPLLVHLARRSQMRPTVFAALRWLRPSARPQRRLRLEEWWLLLLRLLLVGLLALWLARPALHGERAGADTVFAIPGVDIEAAQALAQEGVQVRWLAPGFPGLDQPPPQGPVGVASLLRELDMRLPAQAGVTVAVPERLEGLDAQRPVLSRVVDWRVVPGSMPAGETPERAPPPLVARYADQHASGLGYLRAAVLAWHDGDAAQDEVLPAALAAVALDPQSSHLAWLAPGPLPDAVLQWIRAGGVALVSVDTEVELPPSSVAWWRDQAGEPMVEGARLGAGRLLRFTRPLSPGGMPELLDSSFPRRLRALLEGPLPAPASAPAAAHVPLTGASAYPQAPRDLRPWLALLIGLVFLAERWLATSRRRNATPGGHGGERA